MASKLYILLGLLVGAPLLHAQAVPTATRAGDLQIGGGFIYAQSDYDPEKFKGGGLYISYDFYRNFGVEGQFRYIAGPKELSEKTYEIGGRYHRNYGRFSPYAKLMVGRGVFNFPNSVANLAYNIGGIGGGVDYKVKSYITVRADFEYQKWLSFPPNTLSPYAVMIGGAYHFH